MTGQRSKNFAIIQNMINMSPNSKHGLNNQNVEKLKFVANICWIFILHIMRYSFTSIFGAVYAFYYLIAYFRNEYHFSIVWFIIWFIILMTWAHFITSPITFTYAVLYFSVFYLRQRFKQLNEKFCEIRGICGLRPLFHLFIAHNRLSIITYKYNQFFKYLILINHFCITYIVTLMYFIFFYGRGPLFIRLANLMVGVWYTIVIFLVTRFSAGLAKESSFLYSEIYSYLLKKRTNYKTKWKVNVVINFEILLKCE